MEAEKMTLEQIEIRKRILRAELKELNDLHNTIKHEQNVLSLTIHSMPKVQCVFMNTHVNEVISQHSLEDIRVFNKVAKTIIDSENRKRAEKNGKKI